MTDVVVIGCWFLVSRLWLFSVSVQPDPATLDWLWQVLPLEALAANLSGSLWYLHSQPPLFNAIVGVVLHLPGDVIWLRLLFWELGLALVLVMFASLRSMGLPRALAHALVLLFSLNPTPALYENFYFYSYLEAFLVSASLFTLLGHAWRPVSYGIASSLLVSLRALFQPVWALAIAIAITTTRPAGSRRTSVWLFAPILVGVLLIFKNGMLFGVWSTSSWYGLNLARLPTFALQNQIAELGAAGIVSPAFVSGPFLAVSSYSADVTKATVDWARQRYGVAPVLMHELKDSGYVNFNHAGEIAVSRQLARDSLAAMRARPGPVAQKMVEGVVLFFKPASDSLFLSDNLARLYRLDQIWRAALYPGGSIVVVAGWLVLAVVSSGWLWWRGPADASHLRAAAAFVCLTTLWVATVGNLTEYGENNRFRFALDPMLLVWNAGSAWWLCVKLRSRWQPAARNAVS